MRRQRVSADLPASLMIGLDTHVLVRYLAQDDPRQSASASRFIETRLSERAPGFISLVVLVELCWVLERLYSATHQEIGQTVADLLETPRFHLQHREAVQKAVRHFHDKRSSKAGLADLLIAQLALHAGCSSIVSFDRAAVRAAGMTLLD
jgi:predicted nucleic-acid-binding protein